MLPRVSTFMFFASSCAVRLSASSILVLTSAGDAIGGTTSIALVTPFTPSYVTNLTLGRRFLVVVINRSFQRDPAIRHDHFHAVSRDSAIQLECRPRGFCYLSVGSLIVQLDPDVVGQGCYTSDVFRYALRGPFFCVAGYVPRESDDAVFDRDRYFASVDAGLPFKRPLDVALQLNVGFHKRGPLTSTRALRISCQSPTPADRCCKTILESRRKMTPVACAPHHCSRRSTSRDRRLWLTKGALLAKSLRFHAMLSKQAVERLAIYSRSFRSSGDVAGVAIERAFQVRRFEQIQVLSLGGAERQFA